MKVDKQKNYTVLGDEEHNVKNFASYLEFIVPKAYSNENLIIDLLKYENLELPQLLAFLELSNKQRGNKKSFVLVNKGMSPERIPEELMVVPTLQEAHDVIELEEIQRDLGF